MPFTARRFARAIIMPNLVPPVTTVEQAIAYRERILRTVPQEEEFNPHLFRCPRCVRRDLKHDFYSGGCLILEEVAQQLRSQGTATDTWIPPSPC